MFAITELTPTNIGVTIGILCLLPICISAIYKITFDPLAKVPGPKLFAISQAPYFVALLSGRWPYILKKFHEKYGPVVRFAPTDVSVMGGNAVDKIYGFKKGGQPNFAKDVRFARPRAFGTDMLIADDADHARMRRKLTHAFSDKALRSQEELLTSYVDLLVERLQEKGNSGSDQVVDMVSWYNFTTFDIIGDLTYAESFDCLQDGKYHPWIKAIFSSIKFANFNLVARRYPMFGKLLVRLIPKELKAKLAEQNRFTGEKSQRRLDQGEGDRPDFVSYALKNNEDPDKSMTIADLKQNLGFLIFAGSETTATLLSGVTYFLLKNPNVYNKLVNTIRTQYATERDINLISVGQDKYLLAVLNEGLRLYPPVPINTPRFVPKGGAEIEGYMMPEMTSIAVPQYVLARSERYFTRPDEFIPERWMGEDEEFKNDQFQLVTPFLIGPRACLGKNLAIAEMRLILARVLWNFDLELQPDSDNWYPHFSYMLWEKPSLMVKIVPRVRES